jgi:hypothetical protein
MFCTVLVQMAGDCSGQRVYFFNILKIALNNRLNLPLRNVRLQRKVTGGGESPGHHAIAIHRSKPESEAIRRRFGFVWGKQGDTGCPGEPLSDGATDHPAGAQRHRHGEPCAQEE